MKKSSRNLLRPIFIGGCGRSGTTMLGAMLGAHSRMLTIPEYHCKVNVLKIHSDFSIHTIPEAIEMFKHDPLFSDWQLDKIIMKVHAADFDGSYKQFIEFFVHQYVSQHIKNSVDYWVDHTPINVKHAHFLLSQFPGSRLIHIVRDGRAVTASVLPLDWGPNTIISSANEWLTSLSFGLAAELRFSSDRVHRVYYEDLVREPSRILSEICDFLGVGYEKNMEFGKGFDVPKSSKQQHKLVGQPPDSGRIDAWQKTLKPHQIETFEFFAGEMLALLDYTPRYGISAPPPTSLNLFFDGLADIFLAYFRRFRYFKRNDICLSTVFLRKIIRPRKNNNNNAY